MNVHLCRQMCMEYSEFFSSNNNTNVIFVSLLPKTHARRTIASVENKLKQSAVWAPTALFSRNRLRGQRRQHLLHCPIPSAAACAWCILMSLDVPDACQQFVNANWFCHLARPSLPYHLIQARSRWRLLSFITLIRWLISIYLLSLIRIQSSLMSCGTESRCVRLIGDAIPPYLLHNWS